MSESENYDAVSEPREALPDPVSGDESYRLTPKGLLCALGLSDERAAKILDRLYYHAKEANPDLVGRPALVFDDGAWHWAKVATSELS